MNAEDRYITWTDPRQHDAHLTHETSCGRYRIIEWRRKDFVLYTPMFLSLTTQRGVTLHRHFTALPTAETMAEAMGPINDRHCEEYGLVLVEQPEEQEAEAPCA
jgi:hypothetical protein